MSKNVNDKLNNNNGMYLFIIIGVYVFTVLNIPIYLFY